MTTTRDPLQRIDRLMSWTYQRIDQAVTPSAFSCALGLLLWLADERERRMMAGKRGNKSK